MFPLHSRKENRKSSTVPRADNEETIRMSFRAKFKSLREAKGMPRAGIDELFDLMPGTVFGKMAHIERTGKGVAP